MSRVALIIIFNHQYNKNIDILEEIYKERFTNIYHLVPFYTGKKENVIPVYYNSYYFQGYVSQGLKSFYKENYEHYFFIGDDLILNPLINERNYLTYLKLNIKSCFISEIYSLHSIKEWWHWAEAALKYKVKQDGIEVEEQLPDFESALRAFKHHNLEIGALDHHQIWKTDEPRKDKYYFFRKVLHYYNAKQNKAQYNLSYPLVRGYSDIFVISADIIKQFSHYCGIFAATGLFVEIAIPTSLVLSSKEIITENILELQGKAMWVFEDYKILDKYNYNLNILLNDFPSNHLYLHPIKLSKWKFK